MATTRVSERGQVVIPKAIRDKLGIKRGQLLDVREMDGAVVLHPRGAEGDKGPASWRGWGGVLGGSGALEELEAEHRREIERGR